MLFAHDLCLIDYFFWIPHALIYTFFFMFRFPIPLFFRYRSKFRIPHIPIVMKSRDRR